MRPIVRGPCPQESGKDKIFKEYAQARKDLIGRLGSYCSYCEMELDASLAIEHVQPKSIRDDLETTWDNFLLACTNCNSIKTDKHPPMDSIYWPDRDNTFRAFEYGEEGLIGISPSLSGPSAKIADDTMELTGLDRRPDRAQVSDRRWSARREAWNMARRSKKRLRNVQNSNPDVVQDFREQVLETVRAKGFWSVWMTVFADQPEVLKELIAAFPGTAESCFNPEQNYSPEPRPSGLL